MATFKRIVILTGAGISAESGISTFRDAGGTWDNHEIDEVATPEAFEKNPNKVWKFYNERRKQLLDAAIKPNEAHKALAKLEHDLGTESVLIVTQNVDNLHERAGNFNVIHMHGSLLEGMCTRTGKIYPWLEDMGAHSICPCCGTVGAVRPHVVWFGETPLHLDKIFTALEQCDLFMSIGTSGQVYPAGGFVQHVRMNTQAHCVEMNLEPSAISSAFHERITGQATVTVPNYITRKILATA